MKLVIQINASGSNSAERVELELSAKGALIGRKRGDIIITDVKCSQRHAALTLDNEQRVWIKDLDSTNGVKVNGKKVTKAEITVNTLIKIGSTLLFVEAMGEEIAPIKKVDVIHGWPNMFYAIRKKKEFSSYL